MRHLIEKEDRVRADAIALVNCGLRPKVVRLLIGNDISIQDCIYLFKILTPLAPHERHGRTKFNIAGGSTDRKVKPSAFRRLTAANTPFCINAMKMVSEAIELGASRADAVASVWRIATGDRELPMHHPVEGITAEDLAFIWLNYKAAEISIKSCGGCSSQYIDSVPSLNECPYCKVSRRVLKRKAA